MFGEIPYAYDDIMLYNRQFSPSTVHVKNTALSRFFARYLFQKAISVFKWDLPEEWARDYFLYTLYGVGYAAIINTDKFGVIPQHCTLTGKTVFYTPREIIVTNPLFKKSYNLIIDRQCTLFKLQPDYGGILDLVSFYADMMALTAETAGVNLVNSKLSYIFAADSKAMAESFKKLYDNYTSGQPAAFADKQLFNADGSPRWQMFQQNVGQNYIVSNLLIDLRKWEAKFCTDVGIPNANTDKKERVTTDEVNSNNTETRTRCDMWLESLQTSCKKANKMFGLNLSVDWRDKNGQNLNTGYVSA